uniref:NADH dehydrogenase subunit 6 n=1 Tax=Microcosmus sulcatus TaxID=341086 RepID=D2YVH1_9ASCI|nr:NADH dehydrogenase subunit 6 [Microcosmus sulcatus]CAL23094.2 NADH dehydrogenase subunit 6 [Microcosmus sulcatus]
MFVSLSCWSVGFGVIFVFMFCFFLMSSFMYMMVVLLMISVLGFLVLYSMGYVFFSLVLVLIYSGGLILLFMYVMSMMGLQFSGVIGYKFLVLFLLILFGDLMMSKMVGEGFVGGLYMNFGGYILFMGGALGVALFGVLCMLMNKNMVD